MTPQRERRAPRRYSRSRQRCGCPAVSAVLFVLLLVIPGLASLASPAQPRGRFKGVYQTASAPPAVRWQQVLRDRETLEGLVASLNARLTLPTDVTLMFAECSGVSNAFYHPPTRQTIVFYELVDHVAQVLGPGVGNPRQVADLVIGNVHFVFLHEVGHALIDVLNLPVLGREEDAADQLATWLLVSASQRGETAMLAVARYFAQSKQPGALWDEHPLDEQRYYNILCWLYGQNTQQNAFLVADHPLPIPRPLPMDRARRCPAEVQRFQSSLLVSLTPFLRRGDQPDARPPTPPPASSWAPSFSCAKAATGSEKLICSNQELSALDVEMARLYRDALEVSSNKEALRDEQRSWLRARRDRCPDVGCMRQAYRERIAQLSR
jgi:hypothetical protein